MVVFVIAYFLAARALLRAKQEDIEQGLRAQAIYRCVEHPEFFNDVSDKVRSDGKQLSIMATNEELGDPCSREKSFPPGHGKSIEITARYSERIVRPYGKKYVFKLNPKWTVEEPE